MQTDKLIIHYDDGAGVSGGVDGLVGIQELYQPLAVAINAELRTWLDGVGLLFEVIDQDVETLETHSFFVTFCRFSKPLRCVY